jgi:hypothetical protein
MTKNMYVKTAAGLIPDFDLVVHNIYISYSVYSTPSLIRSLPRAPHLFAAHSNKHVTTGPITPAHQE